MSECPPHAHCTYRCGDDCTVPEGATRTYFLHKCELEDEMLSFYDNVIQPSLIDLATLHWWE